MHVLGPTLLILSLAAPAGSPADLPVPASDSSIPHLLLGPRFPIEAEVSFPGALLHWLDSLANLSGYGMTSGKTRRAHLLDFDESSRADDQDLRHLEAYARVRVAEARGRDGLGGHDLAVAFFESSTTELALARVRRLLDSMQADSFEAAIRHFTPRYLSIWRDGIRARTFLERAAGDPRREELEGFLVEVARFYGVPRLDRPYPRLILAPVRDGFGTHAQAVDRFLLIEVREGEGLIDEVAPIVHENAHFLFQRMEPARRARLREVVRAYGEGGERAWDLLHEALPTAIAQGISDARFRKGHWSIDRPWYHLDDVDAYAKRLFPLVRETFEQGGSFDERFLHRAIAVHSRPATAESSRR